MNADPPGDRLAKLTRSAHELCAPQAMADALAGATPLLLAAYERAMEGGEPNQIAFWQEVKRLSQSA
jgi:hypothetical protein